MTISTTLDSFETILKIIDQDPIIYGTFGIHPHEADKEKVLKNDIINKIKLNKKIIGVGESGLDFFFTIIATKKIKLKVLKIILRHLSNLRCQLLYIQEMPR